MNWNLFLRHHSLHMVHSWKMYAFYLKVLNFCLTCTLDFTFATDNRRTCVNYWREWGTLRQSWSPVAIILVNIPPFPLCLDSLLLRRTSLVPFLRHTHSSTKISACTSVQRDYRTPCLLHPPNRKARLVILRNTGRGWT